jgi:hypothetical protein
MREHKLKGSTLKKITKLTAIILFAMTANVSKAQSLKKSNHSAASKYSEVSRDYNPEYNLRFNPIVLLVGVINAELDYKLNDQVTVGPSLAFYSFKTSGVSVGGTNLGIQSRYFFKNFSDDSWYVTGRGLYSTAEATISSLGIDYKGKYAGLLLGFGGGYHWFWDSFNMNLGAGLLSSQGEIELTDSTGSKYPTTASPGSSFYLEYTIGWLF